MVEEPEGLNECRLSEYNCTVQYAECDCMLEDDNNECEDHVRMKYKQQQY